jgi:alginate O-acetyltransferase complex protein AlgI
MLFNSLAYVLFFPAVVTAYFLLPHRFRWIFLLAASCFFYAALIPVYILFLFALILIDYVMALFIERSAGRIKFIYLICSILMTASSLLVFKYFNFFNHSIDRIADLIGWNYSPKYLALALPVGLSFHTFQSLSYVIEVYRGRQKPERHLGIYALYVMFFPQLVAGPIERPQNLIHQLREKHRFDPARAVSGFQLMLWGFLKKMVVADNLAYYVNAVYAKPDDQTGIQVFMAMCFFAIQIYCDFSGYSDIAIGSAEVMGIRLRKNFDRPFFATGIAEFWRRWHMSLSDWFKDYVYLPLGGRRASYARWVFAILITFILSGLWHGAGATYVLWGLMNGAYIVIQRIWGDLRTKVRGGAGSRSQGPLGILGARTATFFAFAASMVLFRAPDTATAWSFYQRMWADASMGVRAVVDASWTWAAPGSWLGLMTLGLPAWKLILGLLGVAMLFAVETVQSRGSIRHMIGRSSTLVRWPVYVLAIVCLLLFSYSGERQEFIYFQF